MFELIFKKSLSILIWIIGLTIFLLSFFLEEQNNFSPSQESENEVYKNTGFTKLTRTLRNLYFFLLLTFFILLFLYNHFS